MLSMLVSSSFLNSINFLLHSANCSSQLRCEHRVNMFNGNVILIRDLNFIMANRTVSHSLLTWFVLEMKIKKYMEICGFALVWSDFFYLENSEWFQSPRKWAFDLIQLIKSGNFFEFMRWRGKLLQFYVNMSLWLIEWIVECIKLVSLHGFMGKRWHYVTCVCYCIPKFNDFRCTLDVYGNQFPFEEAAEIQFESVKLHPIQSEKN